MSSLTNRSFVWQEQISLAASYPICLEAARQTLIAMGANPQVFGPQVTGKLGSQFKMRFVGIMFCPGKWLPISAEIVIGEAADQRRVTITVRDRLEFGFVFIPSTIAKYQSQCIRTGISIRDAMTARASTGS